ncbi:bidirectional sugar transporter SWEET4-like [Diospyros lotus]|uniref:bidirectional sugar transporter SWEET4-like n=1 Tax=Diospyros lotus TaxID=55363 RepID=UPI00224DE7BE|nr:bidirectional sugar transporter SWEET4-like [Diospyros lotus]
MAVGPADLARTIIGVTGNITSFLLFASPLPTFYRIAKNKSVEEFKPDPYIAGAMNCIFWILYGLPVIHPNSILVLTINGIGLALELGYLAIFFTYTCTGQRLKIICMLFAEVVFTAIVACIALLAFHTTPSRSNFVGPFCVLFGVVLYSSPLTIMKTVIETKSVEFMPFWLSVAAFSNGVVWLIYALIKFDPYIMTGNCIGAILGAAQLVLYAYYYKPTPKGRNFSFSSI